MLFKLKFHSRFLSMAYYHFHGLIPDGISHSEGYKIFENYIASSAPMENFDGFELVSRFHEPETGEVFVTFKADNLAISQHFEVWRAKFGLDCNITVVFNVDKVTQRNQQVADSVAEIR